MQISVTNVPTAEIEADALLLAIPEHAEKPTPWEAVDAAVGGAVSEAIAGPGFHGKRGQTLSLSTAASERLREVVLVGLGPSDEIDLEGWRRAVATGTQAARKRGNKSLAVPLAEVEGHSDAAVAAAAAEATLLASYRYQEYKAPPTEQTTIDWVAIATADEDAPAAVERASTVAEATCWARDLVNRPSSDKRTDALAEMATTMAAEQGLGCEVIDSDKAAELGLNALLAVGGGSRVGPRMVILEHNPGGADGPPVVLVGKGITFDSGGLSLKPAKGMGNMKADMSGAAAVYGTMRALASLGASRWVVGVTPLAENLPSAMAYRPGDIVRAYGGTTIEVINTDAEGRLVLGDALAYARERYEPARMVNVATLTGACVIALGSIAAGLMGNDDQLCGELIAAGEATGERVWRLPMWEEYDKLIDSEVANVRNAAGREAGVITAGKFLQRFVGDTPWAHLDIAGTAFLSKATPYLPKGGTGFGVRLLTHWLTG